VNGDLGPDKWVHSGGLYGGSPGTGCARDSRRGLPIVSMRTREYVLLASTVLVGIVHGRLSREWTDAPFYGGMAGILAALAFVGMPWVEFARDGAFRRRPQP
jgi:heme/copper-type cytochrome/quinol oxidase subunit 3